MTEPDAGVLLPPQASRNVDLHITLSRHHLVAPDPEAEPTRLVAKKPGWSEREIKVRIAQKAKRIARMAAFKAAEAKLLLMKKAGIVPGPGMVICDEVPRATPITDPVWALEATQAQLQAADEFLRSMAAPPPAGSQLVVDDFQALMADPNACQVCVSNIPGCPCCWKLQYGPPPKPVKYDPLNTTLLSKARGKSRYVALGLSMDAEPLVPHTPLTSAAAIQEKRHDMFLQSLIVKTLPSGDEVLFQAFNHYPIAYVYFLYRCCAGAAGTDDKLELLLPTAVGLYHLSLEKQLPTELRREYDRGSFTLADYNCVQRDATISVMRTSFAHSEKNSNLMRAYMHQNFTLARPWQTHLVRSLQGLPSVLPGTDDCQAHVTRLLQFAMRVRAQMEAHEEATRREAIRQKQLAQAAEALETALALRRQVQSEQERAKVEAKKAAIREELARQQAEAEARARAAAEAAAKAEADRLEAERAKTPAEIRERRKAEKLRARRLAREAKAKTTPVLEFQADGADMDLVSVATSRSRATRSRADSRADDARSIAHTSVPETPTADSPMPGQVP